MEVGINYQNYGVFSYFTDKRNDLYSIIDIETTGHSPHDGKITEIAIYVHNGIEVVDSFTSLVNPECHIPYFITKLTGIDDTAVASAPKFYEIAKRIIKFTAGNIFVAHNVRFDYRFIQKEFKLLGYNYKRKTMCTVKLSRKYIPGHSSYSLGNICRDLNIQIGNRHRAAGDALATVKLFEMILEEHSGHGTPDERAYQTRLF